MERMATCCNAENRMMSRLLTVCLELLSQSLID
jgi:hypothetical protein